MDLNRVLVGVDGSQAASAALRWAAAAAGEDGEVVALHATGTTLITQATISAATGVGMFRNAESAIDEARRALDEWCEPLRSAGATYRMVVSDDKPVDALLDHARREEPDLIVIGHEGSTGFLDRLVRDLSEELLDEARRPVVVVPSSL